MSTVEAEKALNSPSDEVAQELLSLSEDQWFERKSGRIKPSDLAKVLVGFANADGGLVVIGLHNGLVEGIGFDVSGRMPWCRPASISAHLRFAPTTG
jgi:ATP-dependent DNA helicase RecG